MVSSSEIRSAISFAWNNSSRLDFIGRIAVRSSSSSEVLPLIGIDPTTAFPGSMTAICSVKNSSGRHHFASINDTRPSFDRSLPPSDKKFSVMSFAEIPCHIVNCAGEIPSEFENSRTISGEIISTSRSQLCARVDNNLTAESSEVAMPAETVTFKQRKIPTRKPRFDDVSSNFRFTSTDNFLDMSR